MTHYYAPMRPREARPGLTLASLLYAREKKTKSALLWRMDVTSLVMKTLCAAAALPGTATSALRGSLSLVRLPFTWLYMDGAFTCVPSFSSRQNS